MPGTVSDRTSDTNRHLNEEHKKYVYSHMVSVKCYARGIVFHRGQDFWVTAGHEDYERISGITQLLTRLSGVLSDVRAVSLPVSVNSPAEVQYVTAAFEAPDGSLLLAVWNNGAAADQDPGGVNIQIPGVQAEALTAVDPIFGGQQLLQFTSGQDGITIQNFLLKDYPIFIRLEKPQR